MRFPNHLPKRLLKRLGQIPSRKIGSAILVSSIFLSVLVLPNFALPTGDGAADLWMLEGTPVMLPALPDDSPVMGSDVIPDFFAPSVNRHPEDVTEEEEKIPTPPALNQPEIIPPETTETDPPEQSEPDVAPAPEDSNEQTNSNPPDNGAIVTNPPEPETDPRKLLTFASFPVGRYYYGSEIMPLTEAQQDFAMDIAEEYGLPVELLYAMMRVETHYQWDIISETDDYGIMQINACNHEMLTERLGVTNFLEYESGVRCGAYMLSLFKDYSETIPQLLMCYNRGVGGARAEWEKGNTFDRYCEKITTEIMNLLEYRNADQH